MFKVRDSRKSFLRKFSLIGVACWGLCVAVLGYSLYSASPGPNENNEHIRPIYIKGRNFYITELQYALILTLPLLGVGSVALMTLLSSPKVGLLDFAFHDS